MTRALLVVMGALMFALPVHAQIAITKVVYDPPGANAGHQWIEIQNTGTEAIDLAAKDIRLFDTSGNHLIKSYAESSTLLVSGGDVVIAQNPLLFLSDTPSFTGVLLKSSFSLSASKGEVGISKTDGTILGKVSYVAPLVVKALKVATVKKPSTTKSSTNKRAQTSLQANSSRYGKGTSAPTDATDVASVGALNWPSVPLLSSVWFVAFLALLAFSSFSLMLIERREYSLKNT